MCRPPLCSFTKTLLPVSGNNLWFGSALICFKVLQIFFRGDTRPLVHPAWCLVTTHGLQLMFQRKMKDHNNKQPQCQLLLSKCSWTRAWADFTALSPLYQIQLNLSGEFPKKAAEWQLGSPKTHFRKAHSFGVSVCIKKRSHCSTLLCHFQYWFSSFFPSDQKNPTMS